MKTKCLVVAILFCTSLIAQEYQTYYEEFDVVLYQLQVNVRDKEGNHVKGLTKDDLEIKLQGQVQKIEALEEISVDSWLDDPSAETFPEQARRLFVFFFDLRYTTKKGVLAARDAAKDFILNDMLPSDLIGVFVFNPLHGVAMVTHFTNNQEQLLNAVDDLGLKAAKNAVQGSAGYLFNSRLDELAGDRRSAARGGNTNTASEGPVGGTELDVLDHYIEIAKLGQRAEKRIYERGVVSFLKSFGKFADGLRLIRGRKNMIWFSSGFDSSSITGDSVQDLLANQDAIERGLAYQVSTDQYGSTNVQHTAQELIEGLQSSGTVIFAVDTSLSGEAAFDKVGLQSLNYFARDTGGKVYANYANFTEPLSEIRDLTNDYYLVSFYPESSIKKGDVGRLKVKVKRPKVKAYSTKGLMIAPDFTKLTNLEKQIHLSEFIGRDQMASAIPVKVSHIQVPHHNDMVKVTVDVELRGDYFTVTENQNIPRNMEIHTLAMTKEENRLFDSAYFNYKIQPKKVAEVLNKTGIKYFGNIFLQPGEYKLKVIVRDLENGKVGSSIQNIVVREDPLMVAGPQLLTEERWVLMRESEAKERQRKAGDLDFSYPFSVNGNNHVPKMDALISNGKEQFFFMVKGETGTAKEVPDVAAIVMDNEGKIMPVPSSAMTADAEFREGRDMMMAFVLSVDFESLNLKSGENYKLMTQFKVNGQVPIRATSSFLVE